MTWHAVRVTARERRDAAMAALFEAGAEGVQEEGDRLTTHFPAEPEARAAGEAVRRAAPGAEVAIEPVPDVDWSLAWRDQARAFSVGALTIAPPWLAEGRDPSRTVVIDPGMAFGTGDHATTRGAARLMQRVVAPGCAVADLGTGSGVLAIAAARLGAARVVAIELDPEALPNARENVARNGVGHAVHLLDGDAAVVLPLVAPFDVVVANILSSVHVALLPAIGAALRPGGHAILAGILAAERDQMREVLHAGGWWADAEDHEDDWWSVLITRA